jgi:hypothetical protein
LSQIALANKPECEGLIIFWGDTLKSTVNYLQIFKVVEPDFGSFIGKLRFDRSNGRVISDSYELIEVASPKIIPDAKIANLLKEKKKCLSRTN